MSLSVPEALIASLENTAGFDKEAFLQVHASEDKITSIRYNPQKRALLHGDSFSSLKYELQKIPWHPDGYYLSSRPSFTDDPLFHGGLYYVQEAGSQFIYELLVQNIAKSSPARVLDLCAAPGGKTSLLASYFENGLVVANDVIKSRVSILTENVTKWGTGNIIVTNNDPKHFERLPGFFDVLLIDAPCSGSGLFRRDNEAIGQWSEQNVLLCSRRQQRILEDAYPCLKEDGLLIYSTCSYSPAEDEEILDWLMDNYRVENIEINLQDSWGITKVCSDKHHGLGYKFFPDKTKSEGFFLAAFRKKEAVSGYLPTGLSLEKAGSSAVQDLSIWIRQDMNMAFFKHGADFMAINTDFLNDLAILQGSLYLKKAGTTIGVLKNKGLVPAHDLAVSTLLNPQLERISLDEAQSLLYLKRKDFYLDNLSKDWVLASFKNIPLGWMKILPNRINNYYPTEWRIRKD